MRSDSCTPFFICGPHCSGKTSLLQTLKREGVLTQWGAEIGKELFYQRKFATEQQDAAFELEVTELELARDATYMAGDGLVGIETWHPGNLAYAAVRNPDALKMLVQRMKTSPLLPDIRGIRLSVSRDTILQRTHTFQGDREWAADFYSRIEGKLDECIQQLGLQDRVRWIDANRDFEVILRNVRLVLSDFH